MAESDGAWQARMEAEVGHLREGLRSHLKDCRTANERVEAGLLRVHQRIDASNRQTWGAALTVALAGFGCLVALLAWLADRLPAFNLPGPVG